jgi:dTDP-4-amino-4,6-dideoxygalactose transaminase
MAKPISISLAPNNEKDDVKLVLRLIFQPWKWKRGSAIKEIEDKFEEYLGVKYAVSFNSGRSALMAIINAIGMKKDDPSSAKAPAYAKASAGKSAGEGVLLQAFTCNASVNPLIWSGVKPVYVDCDKDSYNIDIMDLKRKIASNSRVLMVQHTFGLPADIEEVLAVAKENNMILIEDCAHSLGAEYKGQKVGTFGKAAFFSFGRDKIISSVWGGMAVTNDHELGEKIRQYQEKSGCSSYFWIFQQLLHPILMNYIVLPLYNFLDLGKIFLVLSQWFGILSKAVHWKEKQGKKPSYFPKNMPNALAILALNQFKKLDRFYNHREQLSQFYYNALKNSSFEVPESLSPEYLKKNNIKHSFLRFTIKHKKAHEIIYEAWHKENIIIGDWYTSPVIPADTKLESVGYKLGSCPTAEKLAKTTFNLPTHINISQKDAEKIIKFLAKWK